MYQHVNICEFQTYVVVWNERQDKPYLNAMISSFSNTIIIIHKHNKTCFVSFSRLLLRKHGRIFILTAVWVKKTG